MKSAGSEIVMGIDPGLAIIGIGVLEYTSNKRLRHIYHGVIRTSRGIPEAERLLTLSTSLASLLKRFHPNRVAIEKLFFASNAKTAMTVGQARGAILLTTAQARLPLSEFTPLEVKHAVTSYGRADKSQIQAMVKMILRLPELPAPDDAADALAIAITACHRLPNV